MAPTPTSPAVSSPEVWTRLREVLECEGGIEDLLAYGGTDMFPPEARAEATAVETATAALRAILESHGVYD